MVDNNIKDQRYRPQIINNRIIAIKSSEKEEEKPRAVVFWEEINSPSYTFDYNQVFLIEVGCQLYPDYHIPDFGGIHIFLKLLQHYNNQSDSLNKSFNVVLYSVLSKKQILAIRPEHQVLNLPSTKFIHKVEGMDFEDELKKVLENEERPGYNLAADNLLRGFLLCNKERIKIPEGKKLMIIDDFYEEYEWVYEHIFENFKKQVVTPNVEVLVKAREGNASKEEAINSIISSVNEHKPDYVISDLYICERHKDTVSYKDIDKVEEISGVSLLKKLKNEYPWLPYMMFTTSNKIWNYEVLKENGAWSWVVKDTRVNLSNTQLTETFTVYKNKVEQLMNPEWQFARSLWIKVKVHLEHALPKKLKVAKMSLEQCKNRKTKEYEQIKRIKWKLEQERNDIQHVFSCLKRVQKVYASSRYFFELTSNYDNDLKNEVQNMMISLGDICEHQSWHFQSNKPKKINHIGCFLYSLRSYYAHSSKKIFAPLESVLLAIDLIMHALTKNDYLPQLCEEDIENFTKYATERNIDSLDELKLNNVAIPKIDSKKDHTDLAHFVSFKLRSDKRGFYYNGDLLCKILSGIKNRNANNYLIPSKDRKATADFKEYFEK